jgi:formylglycine-generating enzyme required for sulfatase activity
MRPLPLLATLCVLAAGEVRAAGHGGAATATDMVALPAGAYRPLYGLPGDAPIAVAAFRLDRDPTTRADFLAFVRANPPWRRSAVKGVFADRRGYLLGWRGELDAGDAMDLRRPVTGVSWFAARAYCAWRGKRLPTVHEWEYAAAASATHRDAAREPAFIQAVLTLYATRPRPLPALPAGTTNRYGLRGLHGLAWEWTADFNSVLVSDDSRGVGVPDHDLFCASAAIGATDPSNYPAFLRYALRAGLTGRATVETLGVRCAA